MDSISLKSQVFGVETESAFNDLALQIFAYQRKNNPVYCEFLNLIGYQKTPVQYEEIPCLPITFFKSHNLFTAKQEPEAIFLSSATGGMSQSKHPVSSLNYYQQNCEEIFKRFYGSVEDYTILALLPSYLERSGSSLIAMTDYFIKKSGKPSGFFLNEKKELAELLNELKQSTKKIILLGVTFALLEFAHEYPGDYKHVTIMETGGMKGRGKEITREELHLTLKNAFNVHAIHSEYGMTELLSQAYSKENGRFFSPPWLKFKARNPNDPFEIYTSSKSGALNCYDLANIDSVSFIATEDLGTIFDDSSFELIGRMDNSDLRGCNLLVL